MKKIAVVAMMLVVLGWAASARAVIGTIDNVPGATLLLPYFEVDLGNVSGINTLLSINNASQTAALVHIVVYSDLSVPTMGFNMYLTGYDVQTISMRDRFNGALPQTASDGQDPKDTISPQGLIAQDINYASCAGLLPPSSIAPGFTTHLANAHTGKSSEFLGNRCAGQALGDNIARGYVVVNTTNQCTLQFPGDPGYFGNVLTNQNLLWGDYFYVNGAQNFAQGNPLVHIEASSTDPLTTTPGNYTFYGRYVAFDASDNREPLATTFAARYLNGGAFSGGTSLVVWRDSKVNQTAFTCPALPGSRPPWYPLQNTQVVIFDEQEQPVVHEEPVGPPPPGPPSAFPAETQRTLVNGSLLPVPFAFGWIYLNLQHSTGSPVDPVAQAWVETVMDAQGGSAWGSTRSSSTTRATRTRPSSRSVRSEDSALGRGHGLTREPHSGVRRFRRVLVPDRGPSAQEIEVAALVGLQHVVQEQAPVAPLEMRWSRRPCRAAAGQLLVAHP